ncbi:MAG: hypothetical protein EOO02_03105, partial [Chitinophagaceae bacterium]
MTTELEISLIRNADIDRTAYDQCIADARNSLIYAWAFYLDRMAQGWDLIAGTLRSGVEGADNGFRGYDYVMPLVSKRKWGVSYLYQPTFVQQLGIFSAHEISAEVADKMISAAKEEFTFAEIHLNYGNPIRWLASRSNFILDLSPGYDKLSAAFTRDLKNNLKLSLRTSLHYS